jgi:hypothetical protein
MRGSVHDHLRYACHGLEAWLRNSLKDKPKPFGFDPKPHVFRNRSIGSPQLFLSLLQYAVCAPPAL